METKDLIKLASNTKIASRKLSVLTNSEKNNILNNINKNLIKNINTILKNNSEDIKNAKSSDKDYAFIDRLTLTEQKIKNMALAIQNIINLENPVGQIIEEKTLKEEMNLKKITVPLGVLGVIYESRPEITTDIGCLGIKSGNAVILKGGKESINTNIVLEQIMKQSINEAGYDENIINLIKSTDRKITSEFLSLNKYIDLMIPRGGESLVNMVGEQAKMPAITGGIGVSHIYIDEYANIEKAINITFNAKVSKPSVCNALDTLLINNNVLEEVIHKLSAILIDANVEIRCDNKAYELLDQNNNSILLANENDWGTEFLDYKMSIKCVDNIDEAISHIQFYGSGHTDAIISESDIHINQFVNNIDSAAVMINASTQFNDGGEFGMGAEVAISTNKYGARGPMGLKDLCSYKWVLKGNGNIRIR